MTTVLVHEVIKAVRSGKRPCGGFKVGGVLGVVLQRCAPGEPLANDRCWGELENLRKSGIFVYGSRLSGFGWVRSEVSLLRLKRCGLWKSW